MVEVSAPLLRHAEHLAVTCLQLDEDLSELHRRLCCDQSMNWAGRLGAGRMLRSPTAFEDAVKTLCTTNCSWSLTKVMVGKLVSEFGSVSSDGRPCFSYCRSA